MHGACDYIRYMRVYDYARISFASFIIILTDHCACLRDFSARLIEHTEKSSARLCHPFQTGGPESSSENRILKIKDNFFVPGNPQLL